MEKIIDVSPSAAQIPKVVNFADDENVLSATTITPFDESVDRIEIPAEDAVPEAAKQDPDAPTEEVKETPEAEKEIKPDTPPAEPEAKLRADPIGVQKRIDEITKARRTAERLLEAEKARNAELEAKLAAAEKAIPPEDKPTIDQFETETEFIEALTEWKVDQKLKVKEAEITSKSTKDAEAREVNEEVDSLYEKIDTAYTKGREQFADFDDAMKSDDFRNTEAMIDCIMLGETPEKVLYHLAKNPDESAKLAKITNPTIIAYEVGKIEAKLNAPPPAAPPKKLTHAPDPISPVKTTGVTNKRPEDMSMKEYRASRGY